MAQENFNTSFPNDGLGDQLRNAFLKQQAMNTELYGTKVDKVAGKDLSDNNFTTVLKDKLDALATDAEKNVQSDWNELDPTSDAFILGKPIFSTSEIIVSALWTGTGLDFDVIADAFPISGISYPANPAVVSLDAAHATLDRIDLIVAIKPTSPATVGDVGKITGTPATSALVVPPDYDPSIFYVIKQITVKAAATEPDGVENTVIFDDDLPGEWSTALFGGNAAINTSDPSTGTDCIEFTAASSNDYVVFTAPVPISTSVLDVLDFDLKLKEVAIGKFLVVKLRLNGVNVSQLSFNSGSSGFDDSNLSYQTISIDKSKFNYPITDFNEIQMFLYDTGSSGYFLDNVKMFTGSGSETVPDTGISEAPVDGKQYARKNAGWEAVKVVVAESFVYSDPTNTFTTANIIADLIDVQIGNGCNFDSYASIANGNEVTIDNSIIFDGDKIKIIYNKQ